MQLHVALYQPEIAPNTGNIIRLCANTGAHLHLIHPLGFSMDEKRLRRAGLDYHEWAQCREHENWQAFEFWLGDRPLFALTTKAARRITDVTFPDTSVILMGPETRGLPVDILTDNRFTPVRLPMRPESRSLNLSNATAIALYQAWGQHGFPGAQ